MRPWCKKWFTGVNYVDEMETTASNATSDGGYGVNAIRNDGATVLGKGKVDGSIPFGSTIGNSRKSADFLESRPLPKDIPPGSQTGSDDPVERFIASGGRITYCPPAYVGVVNGATPLSSGTEVQLESWKEGVSRIFQRKGFPERKANRHSFKPGQGPTATSFKPGVRSRGAEIAAAKGAARLERLRAEYVGGKTIDDMARDEGCRVTRIRELLRKAGVL